MRRATDDEIPLRRKFEAAARPTGIRCPLRLEMCCERRR